MHVPCIAYPSGEQDHAKSNANAQSCIEWFRIVKVHKGRLYFSKKKGSMLPTRMVIYAADVMCLLGKSERSARRILAQIRAAHHKQKHQPVTIEEFCAYMALSPDVVKQYLHRKP
jgi:hypothetical protein